MDTHFEIMVQVKWMGRIYEQRRSRDVSGCNHYDNIPAVADYMGQAIKEEIYKSHWLKKPKEGGTK